VTAKFRRVHALNGANAIAKGSCMRREQIIFKNMHSFWKITEEEAG
jgi:hypothetical protein